MCEDSGPCARIEPRDVCTAIKICVFARRRRHWLAEQRRRRDAATSVTLPVALVPEDDARDAADAPTAPLTSPRRRQSQAAATDVL